MLLIILISDIFFLLAACTDTKILSVADPLMIPPPSPLNKNFYGKPIPIAAQSSIRFYSSVWDGQTLYANPGVW